ncbi:hypothetical protein A7A08_00104 [Methyloligella halotolerans]|uniref:Uncharacterized protein n=1 Tax=Methyloligella halotolerans TaxID=1177755 RepID=A0A1E2S1B8_9HYPH|nr:hypothetical protein [Methyloligella halotolerans]ODA68286.1 hypothetical protein A7A08_00104 [Methyloligella halotolerans]
MKFVLSLAAVLALAFGVTLPLGNQAEAGCWKARCARVAVVPAPVVVEPVPVAPPEVVYAVPQPNPIPLRRSRRCGGNCYTSYRYPLYAGGYTANAPWAAVWVSGPAAISARIAGTTLSAAASATRLKLF